MGRFNVVALKDATVEKLNYILSLRKQFYSLIRQESNRLWRVLPVRDIPLGSGNLRITDSTLRVSSEFRKTKTCDGVLAFTHYTYNGSEITKNKVYEGTYTNPIKIHWRTLRLRTVGYVHSCPFTPASQHLLVVRVDGKLYQYKTASQGISSSI